MPQGKIIIHWDYRDRHYVAIIWNEGATKNLYITYGATDHHEYYPVLKLANDHAEEEGINIRQVQIITKPKE